MHMAASSPITIMLSQHEILVMLCSHLSSADIIHLGATSREHWQYLTCSKALLDQRLQGACCDGRGVIARAKLFGHWRGSLDTAREKCDGREARPCEDCGAVVCNVSITSFICPDIS